jgi:hypothetical protein
MTNSFLRERMVEGATAVDGRDDSGKALVTVRIEKNRGALWPSPKAKMLKGPVQARKEVGSQAVGKIERCDHSAQKTEKSPGKQQSLLGVGHGPLPHLLRDDGSRLTKFAEPLAELISNNTTFRMRTCRKCPARLRRDVVRHFEPGRQRWSLSNQFFSTLNFLE